MIVVHIIALPFLNKGMTRAAADYSDCNKMLLIAFKGLATVSAESIKSELECCQRQLLYQVIIYTVEISHRPQTLQQI